MAVAALERVRLVRVVVQMTGFVLVKKVPGTMHFHMKQEGISFAGTDIDVSHVVNEFTFGNRPSPRRLKTLARLHPGGLARDWADKLSKQAFMSSVPETTHEHYLQLVKTTLEPNGGAAYATYDAYEYTVHSHSYVSEVSDVPAAKFTFQTNAMQVRSECGTAAGLSPCNGSWFQLLCTCHVCDGPAHESTVSALF